MTRAFRAGAWFNQAEEGRKGKGGGGQERVFKEQTKPAAAVEVDGGEGICK